MNAVPWEQKLELEFKAYAAVVYLTALLINDDNPESLNVYDHTNTFMHTHGPEIYDLALAITRTFNPRETEPEVNRMALVRKLDYSVSEWFPTARERLECREWLIKLFLDMNMDTNLVERAFPRSD